MADNTIENGPHGLRAVTGTHGVGAFRFKALALALEFRKETGWDMYGRRFNSVAIARRESGLRTRNIDVLIAWAYEQMNAEIDQCEIRTASE